MNTRNRRHPGAFTLVELLVVMGVIGLLIGLSSLALSSIGKSNTLSMSASNLNDLLQQARVYATSNHTYVYVGVQETDSASTNVQGTGHVSVMVVASVTGTRPYGNTPAALTSAQVIPVGKLEFFDNLDFTASTALANGGLAKRPPSSQATGLFDATTAGFIDLSLNANKSKVTFQWPLAGTAAHTFTQVIEFDSQGVARVQNASTYTPTIPSYIELALVPTHGTSKSATVADAAAIQVDGMTGTVRTYRP